MKMIGLENLLAHPSLAARWGRLGLLCNQASVTLDWTAAWEALPRAFPGRFTTLFGPQHGFFGTVQDNMIETAHAVHPGSGLPLYSLYSETREPTPAMLANVDTLLIDLQIVGCRIYTWKSTIAGCLRAARKLGLRVVVLDRPNPIGGEVIEGRVLDDDAHSFVGEFPIPMRHGLTAGEAAKLFNADIGAELEVVPLIDWNSASYWHQLGRPWVITSPNLPTFDPVVVYPGTVMFEGTNVSEGRGTGLPFQFVGAPWAHETAKLRNRVVELARGTDALSGVWLREAAFEPTSQKWRGQTCHGLQIHVTDPERVRSFGLSVALIRAFADASDGRADAFQWKSPPYEYDFTTLPIKLIFGSHAADKKWLDPQFSLQDPFWNAGHRAYIERIQDILLYPRRRFVHADT